MQLHPTVPCLTFKSLAAHADRIIPPLLDWTRVRLSLCHR
jgi:hypothetical protein